jgi:hypothetical protein
MAPTFEVLIVADLVCRAKPEDAADDWESRRSMSEAMGVLACEAGASSDAVSANDGFDSESLDAAEAGLD